MAEKDLTEASEIDRICTVVPGSFSVFAALLVGLSVCLFKKLQTQSFYLVVLQNLSEMVFNLSIIGFYHPPVHGNWQCQFQGWLINYGIMSSIFFSGTIAGHMYLTIKMTRYKLTNHKLLIIASVIALLSGGIAAIPFSTHQYEDLNANCWLAEGEYGTSVTYGIVMRFATHYCLIWLTCIFCAFCYIAIVRYVQDIKEQLRGSVLSSRKGPSEMEKTIYRLQYYPGTSLPVSLSLCLYVLLTLSLSLSLSDLDVRMVWNHDVSTLHFHVPFQTSPDLGSLHRPRDLEHTRPPEWDCLLLGLTSFSFFSALTDHCLSLTHSVCPLPCVSIGRCGSLGANSSVLRTTFSGWRLDRTKLCEPLEGNHSRIKSGLLSTITLSNCRRPVVMIVRHDLSLPQSLGSHCRSGSPLDCYHGHRRPRLTCVRSPPVQGKKQSLLTIQMTKRTQLLIR
jgi:hypothetical protein